MRIMSLFLFTLISISAESANLALCRRGSDKTPQCTHLPVCKPYWQTANWEPVQCRNPYNNDPKYACVPVCTYSTDKHDLEMWDEHNCYEPVDHFTTYWCCPRPDGSLCEGDG